MKNVSLLTAEERAQLPMVISRRARFKSMIKSSVVNYDKLFSNCLMIQGKAGTGKTTLCETFLEQLKEDNIIAGTIRVPGHVTPKSMYHVMKDTATPDNEGRPYVLLLDDVDCLGDEGCLELMKAAFDTKANTPTNRKVFYMTEDGGKGFKFKGFGIIICNNDFGNRKLSVHQEALLDRVQQLSIDLQPNDMMIFTTHLLEEYINENADGLNEDEIQEVINLFNTDIRRWMEHDAFRKARVNYSIRLIKKFVDAQKVYGDDWKYFNVTYRKLEAACELSEIQAGVIENPEDVKVRKARVVKKGEKKSTKKSTKKASKKSTTRGKWDVEPPKDEKGRYVDPKTGVPYDKNRQFYLRNKFGKAC